VALLAAGLAGCGGAKPSGGASTSTGPAATASVATSTGPAATASVATSSPASSSPSAGRVSRSAALAFARAVNLQPGDLPGATARKAGGEAPPPSAGGEEFAHCAGAPSPTLRVADVRSPTFGSRAMPGGQIKSSVEVMPSAALARETFTAAVSSRGRACLSKLLPALLGRRTGAAVTISHTTISTLPTGLPAGQSFGYRIRLSLGAKRPSKSTRKLAVYVDVFELLHGPAEVGLTDSSPLRPPPSSLEVRVLKALAERARAHSV
jgi:hypothetical protein